MFDNHLLGKDRNIRAINLDAAYAMFFDDKVGSLEVGKYADLVELDANPRSTDPEKIPQIKVMATWLEGKPAYIGGEAAEKKPEAKSQGLFPPQVNCLGVPTLPAEQRADVLLPLAPCHALDGGIKPPHYEKNIPRSHRRCSLSPSPRRAGLHRADDHRH